MASEIVSKQRCIKIKSKEGIELLLCADSGGVAIQFTQGYATCDIVFGSDVALDFAKLINEVCNGD